MLQLERRPRWHPCRSAITRLEQCLGLADSLIPERTLAPETLAAAARHQHSVYDMMYAVLARRSAATVITADRTFALRLRDMEIETYCPLLVDLSTVHNPEEKRRTRR